MLRGKGGPFGEVMRVAVLAWLPLGLLTACENDDPTVEPELPPVAVSVQISASVDTVSVTWTASTAALSYRVELAGGAAPITRAATSAETGATFTGSDGIVATSCRGWSPGPLGRGTNRADPPRPGGFSRTIVV